MKISSTKKTYRRLLLLVSRIRWVLLVRQTTLSVRALRVPLTVHLAAGSVLWRAVDLLRLRILSRRLARWLVSDRWQLRSAHLVRHHSWLAIVARSALLLTVILTVPSGFLTCSLIFLLALILFLLLASLPLLTYFYSSVSIPSKASCRHCKCNCGTIVEDIDGGYGPLNSVSKLACFSHTSSSQSLMTSTSVGAG